MIPIQIAVYICVSGIAAFAILLHRTEKMRYFWAVLCFSVVSIILGTTL